MKAILLMFTISYFIISYVFLTLSIFCVHNKENQDKILFRVLLSSFSMAIITASVFLIAYIRW